MENLLSQLPPLVLLAAYAGFWIWEGIEAARSEPRSWRRCGRNLALSIFGFVIGGLAGAGLLTLSSAVEAKLWALAALASAFPGATALMGVLLLDLTDYWRHRISHSLPLLWRLHRVHHSDACMDVTTSLRSHPMEFMLRPAFLGTAILAFGIPTMPVLIFTVLQLPVLVFQHANIRLPRHVERGVAWLLVTPTMHVVHHSRWMPETNSNYATFLSMWDHIFRSFQPSKPPLAIGLDGVDGEDSQSFLGMLKEPWRRRSQDMRAGSLRTCTTVVGRNPE